MLMAVMMTPRETWTDQRLDDLNKKVDKGFADVDAHFHRFEKSVAEGFARVDADIRELRGDVKDLNTRFDTMHQTMVRGFIALAGLMVTCFVGLAGLTAF